MEVFLADFLPGMETSEAFAFLASLGLKPYLAHANSAVYSYNNETLVTFEETHVTKQIGPGMWVGVPYVKSGTVRIR